MANVTIYTTQQCPFCIRAKILLKQKQVLFTEIAVDNNPEKRAEMQKLSGGYTVPQIFIDEKPIGGFSELSVLEASGELEILLEAG